MAEVVLDQFIPLPLGWIATAAQDWEADDAGPIFFVILYMWPKGCRVRNDPKKLAAVAKVTPKAWARILASLGGFFRVDGDYLVQDFLAALYVEKSKVRGSNVSRASKGAQARWGTKPAADASSNAPGNASSIASGNAPDILRASSSLDLKSFLEGEEKTIARAVPVSPDDPEITQALLKFPRTRALDGGGTAEVVVGQNAKFEAAVYLTEHPGYPLLAAVRYSAAQGKRMRNWDNWIANPPAQARVLAWLDGDLKEKGEKRREEHKNKGYTLATPRALRPLVREILDNADTQRSLAHADV